MLTSQQLIDALEELFLWDHLTVREEEDANLIAQEAAKSGRPVTVGKGRDGWVVRLADAHIRHRDYGYLGEKM